MKFLDSTAGRTLIIAAVAAGVTIFASDWDNGWVDVVRSGGAAFFGALAPLVAYLKLNSAANQDQPENAEPEPEPLVQPRIVTRRPAVPPPVPPIDFDKPYHYGGKDNGTRHPGDEDAKPHCPWCLYEATLMT